MVLHYPIPFEGTSFEDGFLELLLDAFVEQVAELDVAKGVADDVEAGGVLGGIPDVVSVLAAEWLAQEEEKLREEPLVHLPAFGLVGELAPHLLELLDVLDVQLDQVVLRVVEV